MSGLKRFLADRGIRVKQHGQGPHIAFAAEEAALAGIEMFHLGGAGVGAGAAVAGPILGLVAVGVALGSGYAEARELVENENVASGFSQGFVSALLGWTAEQTIGHFGRSTVIRINSFDEKTDEIRVDAYMRGLRTGYSLGASVDGAKRKEYLREIKSFSNAIAPRNWSGDVNKRARINYVIDLASSGLRKHYMQ
jgi:hypothetical protein